MYLVKSAGTLSYFPISGTVKLTVNSEVSEGEDGERNELQVCRVGSRWWKEGTEAQI